MTMKKQKTLQHIAAVAVVLLTFCLMFAAPVSAEATDGADSFAEGHVASATKGDTTKYYTDIQEAIKEAAPGGTVEILGDITVDKWIMFSETLSIGDGTIITMNINGLTINGNNHNLTIKAIESAGNGNRLFYDATNLNINNLIIKYADVVAGGIGLQSGTISGVTIEGGCGIFPSTGNIVINGCTFETSGHVIYYEEARDNLEVTGCTFEVPETANVIILRGNEMFADNIIKSGRTVNVASGSPTVTGNDFGDVRFKVHNDATAEISDNKINTLAFDENDKPINSRFKGNTLSEAAKTALNAVYTPTITFETDGGSEIQAISEKSGTTITAPANPTKNGYVFGGWNPAIPATMPDEDMTVKAIWEAIVYDISAAPTEVGFDSVKVGYTQPEAKEVVITNLGNVPVTLNAATTSTNYVVTVAPATEIAAKTGTATVSIQPKEGLAVGNYADTLTIQVEGSDEVLTIPVSFLVYQPSSGGSSKPVEEPEEPVVEPEVPTEEPEAGEATVETEVTDGGEVEFEAPVEEPEAGEGDTPAAEDEAKITGVVLPTGTEGKVEFVPISEQAAPEGKETQTKKVFEINVPNYEKGKPATIKFTMTVAELAADGKEAADVALWHFDEETGEWTKLVTSYTIVDGVVYFEAITNDFSPFAIVYEDEPVDEPVDEPETPASPAPVLGLIAALGAAVALRRK